MITLPADFMSQVMATISNQISQAGFVGIAIMAIGIVGVFFVIDLIIGAFEQARMNREILHDNFDTGSVGRSFDRRS